MVLKKTAIHIYNRIPTSIKNTLGKLTWLKPIRDSFFRNHGTYKEVETQIKKAYQSYLVEFKFLASFQVSAKATERGIESTLLNNSIILLQKYISHNNDLTVLDVGANFGFLSLVWANSVAKYGQTISFEPNVNLFNTFKKTIRLNSLDNKIILFNKAVGFENRIIKLFMDDTTSNTLSIDSSIAIQEVEMISLDDFFVDFKLKSCDLLKIDVDGIELDILKGSKQLIKKFKPIVIIETNENVAIIEFMKNLNYTILDMKMNEYNVNNRLPQNIFCVSNEATF